MALGALGFRFLQRNQAGVCFMLGLVSLLGELACGLAIYYVGYDGALLLIRIVGTVHGVLGLLGLLGMLAVLRSRRVGRLAEAKLANIRGEAPPQQLNKLALSFRKLHAESVDDRGTEYDLFGASPERNVLRGICYFLIAVQILFFTFINLIYSVKFDTAQTNSWLSAIFIGAFADFILFEPAAELVTLVVFLVLEVINKDVVEVIFDSTRVPEPLTVSAVRGYIEKRRKSVGLPSAPSSAVLNLTQEPKDAAQPDELAVVVAT